MTQHRQRAGFTLVEALVALSILVLILGAMLGSLRVTSRSWEAAMHRSDSNEALRLGLDFLRRRIEQAMPLRITDGEDERLMFNGTVDRLQFVAPLPAHTGASALHWLTLNWHAVDSEGRGSLMLAYQPLLDVRAMPTDDGADVAAEDAVAVIEGPGPVSFRYYGSERKGDPPQWHDAWKNESRLPELVQVLFTGGRLPQFWPELVIAPRADMQPPREPFVIRLPSVQGTQEG